MFESTQAFGLSVLPPMDGLLGVLYNQAWKAGTEWQSAGFWLAYLNRALDLEEFVTTAEAPPDKSRRRVDCVTQRYRPESKVLVPCLYTEVKRPEGNIREAEYQAYEAGILSMKHHGLTQMFAMTTSGTRFRAWRLYDNTRALVPLDGENAEVAAEHAYFDILSEEGKNAMANLLSAIKYNPPLPDIQSQQPGASGVGQDDMGAGEDYTEGDYVNAGGAGSGYGMSAGSGYGQGDMGAGENYGAGSGYGMSPEVAGSGYGQGDMEGAYVNAGGAGSGYGMSAAEGAKEGSVNTGPASQSGPSSPACEQVNLKRVHKGTYSFTNAKGKTTTTKLNDWKKANWNGTSGWVYYGKKTIYFTTKIPT